MISCLNLILGVYIFVLAFPTFPSILIGLLVDFDLTVGPVDGFGEPFFDLKA